MIVEAGRSVLAGQGETGALPRDQWPDVLGELEPEQVRVEEGGLFIQTWSFFVEARGYWIPADGASVDTIPGRDPQYRRIADDLYWCEIKG